MRPIKFRAQDIASNKWLYGDIRHHKNDVCIFEQGGNKGEQVKPETVGEFTGLHDKHGKEIYEGDLIRHRNKIVIVEFYQGAFGYTNMVHTPVRGLEDGYHHHLEFIPFYASDDNPDASRFKDGTVFDTDFCEVIGNIIDNPNIIEEGGEV